MNSGRWKGLNFKWKILQENIVNIRVQITLRYRHPSDSYIVKTDKWGAFDYINKKKFCLWKKMFKDSKN